MLAWGFPPRQRGTLYEHPLSDYCSPLTACSVLRVLGRGQYVGFTGWLKITTPSRLLYAVARSIFFAIKKCLNEAFFAKPVTLIKHSCPCKFVKLSCISLHLCTPPRGSFARTWEVASGGISPVLWTETETMRTETKKIEELFPTTHANSLVT